MIFIYYYFFVHRLSLVGKLISTQKNLNIFPNEVEREMYYTIRQTNSTEPMR